MKAKRYLSIVMMFVLLMQLCSVGAVANFSFDSNIAGDQYQNLAEAECALGLSSPNAPMSLNEENISLSALLEQAEPMTETDYDSLDIVSYPTSIVEEYLPQNINIIEVTVSGDSCYITYGIIETHILVYLQYSLEDDSVVTVAVRDMDADSCVTFTAGEKRVEEDLTQGNTFQLSDAVAQEALDAIDLDGPDALNRMEEISWYEEDGVIYIGPNLDNLSQSTRAATKTATFLMLDSLKEDFPSYNNKLTYSGSKYCLHLKQNLRCKTLDNWGEYGKATFLTALFPELTSIVDIADCFGIAVSVVKIALKEASVSIISVIGAGEAIGEAIKAQFGNKYYATVSRAGYVYDITRYNDFVRAYTKSERAEFNWAYYGSGTEGAWEADTKDVFRNTAEYASTLAMTAYNLDLQENEICDNFRPD